MLTFCAQIIIILSNVDSIGYIVLATPIIPTDAVGVCPSTVNLIATSG
jgi:hypothetical protein